MSRNMVYAGEQWRRRADGKRPQILVDIIAAWPGDIVSFRKVGAGSWQSARMGLGRFLEQYQPASESRAPAEPHGDALGEDKP